MLFDLSHIRRAEEHVERIVPPSELDEEDDAYRVVEPAQLAFDVQKDGDAFRLTGSVRSALDLTCSRCLEPYRFPVEVAFDQRYLPQREASDEVVVPDLDASFYRDEQIDLFRRQVVTLKNSAAHLFHVADRELEHRPPVHIQLCPPPAPGRRGPGRTRNAIAVWAAAHQDDRQLRCWRQHPPAILAQRQTAHRAQRAP